MEGEGLAVKGEGQALYVVIPRGCFVSNDEDLVIVEENGDGLDPSEVQS